MPVTCCVTGCLSNSYSHNKHRAEYMFHAFPKGQREREWKIAIKRNKPVYKSTRICSKHFKDEDYISPILGQWKFLRRSAIPSQYLPYHWYDDRRCPPPWTKERHQRKKESIDKLKCTKTDKELKSDKNSGVSKIPAINSIAEMGDPTKTDSAFTSKTTPVTSEEYILPTADEGQQGEVEPWKLFTLNIKKEPEDITSPVSVAEQSIFTIEPPLDNTPLTVESLFTAEQDDINSEIQDILIPEASDSVQSGSSNALVIPKVEILSSDEETLSAKSGAIFSSEISSVDSSCLVKIKEEPIEMEVDEVLSNSMDPTELSLDDVPSNLQAAFEYTLLPESQKGSILHQVLILKTRNQFLHQENQVLRDKLFSLRQSCKDLSAGKVEYLLKVQRLNRKNKNMCEVITQLEKRNKSLSNNLNRHKRLNHRDLLELRHAEHHLSVAKLANGSDEVSSKLPNDEVVVPNNPDGNDVAIVPKLPNGNDEVVVKQERPSIDDAD